MSRQVGVVVGVPWGRSWSNGECRGGLPWAEVGRGGAGNFLHGHGGGHLCGCLVALERDLSA